MAETMKKKPHAIMIAMPFQGHINPFVALALNLAAKGIAITFVHLESTHNKLSKARHGSRAKEFDPFSDARESGLNIRYDTISDGFPPDYDRDLHPEEFWTGLLQRLPPRVDEYVGNVIRSDPLSRHFLVADVVYVWPAAIARKHNLINVAFWTSPALVFTLYYHLELLEEKGHFLFKDDEAEIDYIPGVESIKFKDLTSSLNKPKNRIGNYLFTAFEEVKKADFVLHNTVQELESSTLSALNKSQPHYPIGPIDFSTPTAAAVSRSLHAGVDITEWLHSKPAGSVLYISFGSVVQTSKRVIEEIAHGLLLSAVNFIWVVRANITASEEADGLPAGFEEEVKDRGLVVRWCDQINVLSNPAVGGFLTHCGWNSVMESMWCGVPMICFPVTYDQPTNRKLVVDDWRVGINLCDGGGTEAVDRDGVAAKIRGFMGGSEGLRREATKVKEIIRHAVETGGSSKINFDKFMVDLEKKFC